MLSIWLPAFSCRVLGHKHHAFSGVMTNAGGDPSAGEVEAQRSAVQDGLWQLASEKSAWALRSPSQEKPKRKTLYPSQLNF